MFEASSERKIIGSGPPRPSSQHKGYLFASEVQRAGNKRKGQEMRVEGKMKGDKGKRARVFIPRGRKTDCIERRHTEQIEKWQFIKVQGENSC